MSNSVISYQPQNLDQLVGFAERLSKTGIVPQQYRGKPNDVLAACLWGWETAELTPMTALAYIDVIQGRAAYKSEGLVAIALRKGYILDVEEEFAGNPGTDEYAAICTVTKKNGKTLTRKFSVADAKKAGLFGKDNWNKWLDRMLIARARGFAVRDAAPHAMLSYSAEEMRDIPTENENVGHEKAKDITPPAEQQNAADPHDPITGEVIEPAPKKVASAKPLLQVKDEHGKVVATSNDPRALKQAYDDAKKRTHNKVQVGINNLDLLKHLHEVSRNPENKVLLKGEIETIEAIMAQMGEPDEAAVEEATVVEISDQAPGDVPLDDMFDRALEKEPA